MTKPVLGFAGMTHLGLVSGICAAEKGFKVICFDPDSTRVTPLTRGEIPVSEPGLPELLAKNKERLLRADLKCPSRKTTEVTMALV